VANANPYRYRGYRYDKDINMYYLNSRYYNPQIGRFINADGMLDQFGDIQSTNMYTYCANNPVMYTDITGNSPVLGLLFQFAVSVLCYIGIAIVAIFDEEVREDMNDIGWNPFNSDENLVLDSEKVSFYKGIPTFRIGGDRSGTFGAIFLTNETNFRKNPQDVLRHEFGHAIQQFFLGPIKYGITIGLPSWKMFGQWAKNNRYYDAPWEITADMFGGVESRNHSSKDKTIGVLYFVIDFLI